MKIRILGTRLVTLWVLCLLGHSPAALAQAPLGHSPGAATEAPLLDSLANLRVWLIETVPAKPEQFQDVIGEHLEYQFMLEREGIMFAAGPLLGPEDVKPSGPGLIAIRASSLEEAKRIADADPMHSSGTRTYSIRQWIINEGSINVTIRLSGQNPTVVE
jgi:uncharacterized protein